ncbi:MAG: LPS export ABC transporter permease LptF [Alphaproteobacteria bacterium]|nr:LPS export ABC transporter permease LptF [Alphaproteobacteria bacterium]
MFKQLALGLVLVTFALVCVMWLSQSLRFIEMIVNRGLSIGAFLYLTVLLLPNLLSIILPIAAFIAVAFIFGKLISDRELVVMRASGLSHQQIMLPALIVSFLVALVLWYINLDLLPRSYRAFKDMQWNIRYSYSYILLREGAFTQVRPGVTVYIRERARDEHLYGVMVHNARNPKKPSTLMASRGAMIDTDGGSRIVLYDGNRQEIDQETKRLSVLYFDQYSFDIEPARSGDGLLLRYREPRERTVRELLNVRKDTTVNPNEWGRFIVEGHKRIAQPLSAIGYALIAIACLISGSFSRRAQPQRIVTAIVLMVACQVGTMGIEGIAAKRLYLVPAIYLAAALPIVVGFWFTVRHPRRRRNAVLAPSAPT